MNHKVLIRKSMLCPSCMEEHEVKIVKFLDMNIFKGVQVEYQVECCYCDQTNEYYADETQTRDNDISMKNAYRQKMGLLTADEIRSIRMKYGISQGDLSLLLGWGGKTITRYEGHQVQDIAHDTILRKISDDPEWLLSLLETSKTSLSAGAYAKCYNEASKLFEKRQDFYLRKAIWACYARFGDMPEYNGNTQLSLDRVVDVICYFSNAVEVVSLYKVKLMKLLWYADALSFKRRGHAVTGLVYQALPMGAVPLAHDSIMKLYGIEYEEIDMGNGTGYHFKESKNKNYESLIKEDLDILDKIIHHFGSYTKDAIVNVMHQEEAFLKTDQRDMISFKYAKNLSIE